jgi:hypothetical protein
LADPSDSINFKLSKIFKHSVLLSELVFTGTDGLSNGLQRLRVDGVEHLLSARAGAVISGGYCVIQTR